MSTPSRARKAAPSRRSFNNSTAMESGYAGTASAPEPTTRPASEIQDVLDKLGQSVGELERAQVLLFERLTPVQGPYVDDNTDRSALPSPPMGSDIAVQIQQLLFRVYSLTVSTLNEANRLAI